MARYYTIIATILLVMHLAFPVDASSLSITSPDIDAQMNEYYHTLNYGSATTFMAGSSWTYRFNGVVQFDIGALPSNATVTGASLQLFKFTNSNYPELYAKIPSLTRYDKIIESEVTWDEASSGYSWTGGNPLSSPAAAISCPVSNGWTDDDIKTLVDYYRDNSMSLSTFSIIIRGNALTDRRCTYLTKEYTGSYGPRLSITYTLPSAEVCPDRDGTTLYCGDNGTQYDGGTRCFGCD